MPLKIIPASDPVLIETIVLVIYGPPGVGKTSLAQTASKPLLLDFDRGRHRACNRRDSVQIGAWADVVAITPEDLAPFDTVIVDTAGRALDHLSVDIIRRDPKAGRGGALTLQGFGTLKGEFAAWLRMVRAAGKDVVLVAHMDEQHKGDDVIERIDMQGASKNEVYKSADAMGRFSIVNGKHMLNFNPTDAAFGKNPGRLDPIEVPRPDIVPDTLTNVIAAIKTKLNELSAESLAEQAKMDEWRESFEALTTAAEFNIKIAELANEKPKVKNLLLAVGEGKGLKFDRETRAFTDAPA